MEQEQQQNIMILVISTFFKCWLGTFKPLGSFGWSPQGLLTFVFDPQYQFRVFWELINSSDDHEAEMTTTKIVIFINFQLFC